MVGHHIHLWVSCSFIASQLTSPEHLSGVGYIVVVAENIKLLETQLLPSRRLVTYQKRHPESGII